MVDHRQLYRYIRSGADRCEICLEDTRGQKLLTCCQTRCLSGREEKVKHVDVEKKCKSSRSRTFCCPNVMEVVDGDLGITGVAIEIGDVGS